MPVEMRQGPMHFNAPTGDQYRKNYDSIFRKKSPVIKAKKKKAGRPKKVVAPVSDTVA